MDINISWNQASETNNIKFWQKKLWLWIDVCGMYVVANYIAILIQQPYKGYDLTQDVFYMNIWDFDNIFFSK